MRQLELFDEDKPLGPYTKKLVAVTMEVLKNMEKETKTCPKCNNIHEDKSRPPEGCDMVYGRRGWRQLGVYDG